MNTSIADILLISPLAGALRPSEPPCQTGKIGGKAPVWGREAKDLKNMANEGKYVIHATIRVDGTVARKDVVGAIFGQTEGL